jgi:hypothetical protein
MVDELRLAVEDSPAGDPFAEARAIVHDLVRPAVPGHERDEALAGLVRLVDREGVVGDELRERVGDPVEQRVERLLREDVVEDVREPAVRIEERLGRRGRRGNGAAVDVSQGFHEAAATSGKGLDEFNRAGSDAPSLERGIRRRAAPCRARPRAG